MWVKSFIYILINLFFFHKKSSSFCTIMLLENIYLLSYIQEPVISSQFSLIYLYFELIVQVNIEYFLLVVSL